VDKLRNSDTLHMCYSREHIWMDVNDDIVRVGITGYLKKELGDITFIELPDVDAVVHKDETLVVIESVKIANDIYSPVSGRVLKCNKLVLDNPEYINTVAPENVWLVELRLAKKDELRGFLDVQSYHQYLEKKE